MTSSSLLKRRKQVERRYKVGDIVETRYSGGGTLKIIKQIGHNWKVQWLTGNPNNFGTPYEDGYEFGEYWFGKIVNKPKKAYHPDWL